MSLILDQFITTSNVPVVTGSQASPLIVTVSGLTVGSAMKQVYYLGTSGGVINITATPQISSGSTIGQELFLFGSSNTNYVVFNYGNGLQLAGSCYLVADECLHLEWTGTVWREVTRNL